MNKLLKLAMTKLGCGYVWGSQGEFLTQEKLEWFKRTFGAEHYVFNNGTVNAAKWIGKQCFDCSGLVLWCLQQLGFIGTNQDYNADMFYHQLCTSISKSQLVPGDLVFIDSGNDIVHIGIYAGNGEVVHARGTSYGVVKTTMWDDFNLFGRLKFAIGDDQEAIEKPIGSGVVTNVTTVLNIRNGPGANYDDIGDLHNKDTVPVYEQRNGWYRIGVGKWVSGQYISFMPVKSDVETLVDEMIKDGIVTDKQYWTDVLSGKTAPNPEYLKIAFRRATKLQPTA